jgi:hypothetical protein
MVDILIVPYDYAFTQAMQIDRAFFDQHPDPEDYSRLAIPGEDFRWFPPQTVVHVVNYGEGLRQAVILFSARRDMGRAGKILLLDYSWKTTRQQTRICIAESG